jgi:toxin secretion/phage lysis holin
VRQRLLPFLWEGDRNTMKNLLSGFQVFITLIGGWLGWFMGGVDGFLFALITFVIIDYLTGVMAGIIEKKLSSEIGFRGIFKKVFIFIMVSIGHIIDSRIIGNGGAIRTAVIFFYLSNEGISILENAGRIGLPIPKKLKDVLEQLQDKEKE